MRVESGAGEWRRHWPVVVASMAGVTLFTVHTYSIGVMIAPLESEFGWTRSQISSGPMIVAMLGVLMAPIAGLAIDRFGPRRVAIPGTVLLCVVLALLSTATASMASWWTLWTLLGLAAVWIGPPVWTAAIATLFHSGRGLALALTLCGSGIGASLVPITTNYFVEHYGWRSAYLGLAGLWGLITLPLVFCCFAGAVDARRGTTEPQPVLSGFAVREGLQRASFWKMALGASLHTLVCSSLLVNMVPILSDEGMARATAAAIAGVVGIGSIVGRVCGGYLLDRMNGNGIAGVSVAIPIVSGALLLSFPGSVAMSVAAVLILGLAIGVELDAVAYLAARHLGLRSFGALFGTISGILVLANGLGPFIVNSVYDATRSYDALLWAVIPAGTLSAALFFSLGPYPTFSAAARSDSTVH